MSNYFWQTDRIRLRQVEPDDWRVHLLWDMDSDMLRNLDELHFPKSTRRTQLWAEQATQKPPDGDNFHMQIETLEPQTLIGMISSHDTDRRHGTFMYGIAIRPEFQRQGYAREAIGLLLRFFFDELRYQKCTVLIKGWNQPSIGLHEKLGFIFEGCIRRQTYAQGSYHDHLYYGITVEEWRDQHVG